VGLTVRRVMSATYLAALASLVLAASASAGKYHVYACRTPSGEPAPVDGWSGTDGPTDDSYAKDTCAEGGSLMAALGDQTVHLAGANEALWTLTVPSPETMVGATLWRAGDADGGSYDYTWYDYGLSAPGRYDAFDWCAYTSGCPTGEGNPTEPLAVANRVAVPSASLGSHIYMSADCVGLQAKAECPAGHGDSNGYAAVVYVYAADLLLEQAGGPIAKEAGGPLATESTVRGTADLTFNGSDPGAGVWEVTFTADGRIVQSTVPDENGGHCRDVGQTTDGLAAFMYLQPCPPAESADVGFNTTVLANGEHHLLVTLYDPAGNSATVLDREIDVENGPPVAPASPTVSKPVAKPTPKHRVRARVTLRVAPRRVNGRRSIDISGRLLGGSIPKRGKLLVLEGHLPGGKWSELEVVRTGRHGRFRATYPSEFLGPGRWALRVLCEAAPGYPFATGSSRVVGVRVS
jgi:hypothetical protein